MADSLRKITTNSQPTSTWQSDSAHSSQSQSSDSAIRYDLDDEDTSPILVYTWGGDISTTSQKDLCQQLDNDMLDQKQRRCRVTKKPIPRFASNLDVKRHDLYLPYEHDMYKRFPNYDSALASIRVPSNVYWGRAFFGNFANLYIVSPETSPENSAADSDESRRCSPSSTW